MQFGRVCHLWSRVCLLPSGSGYRQPSSLPPAGDGQVHCQLACLWYLLSPLFYERAQQCLQMVRAFHGKVLSLSPPFFFFLSLAIPWFRLLSHISSLRLPSGHSGLVLTLSNVASASLFSSQLLVADASIWANSPLGVAVRCVICGFYLFFPSRLCCPLRFQNFPQTRC